MGSGPWLSQVQPIRLSYNPPGTPHASLNRFSEKKFNFLKKKFHQIILKGLTLFLSIVHSYNDLSPI